MLPCGGVADLPGGKECTQKSKVTTCSVVRGIVERSLVEFTASLKVMNRRLQWLGHVARMQDQRIPKACLFGWLPQPRPQGGPRRRWRDVIRKDLKEIELPEERWFEATTTSRQGWRTIYKEGLEKLSSRSHPSRANQQTNEIVCAVCSRSFRRESDRKRHKCTTERSKPVCEQRGAVQCQACSKWFRSRGGLSVHTCRPDQAGV